MQAVILAAGRGTRMEPLSSVTAKPMLPVGDQPLVAHVADAAVAAGVDELVFVVGYRGDHVRAYFGDRYGDTPVRYAEQPAQEGTADAVRAARDLVDGRFTVLNGDNVFDPESIVALCSHDAAVATHRVERPREYGVVSTTDGVVTDIVEKPADPPSSLANAGAYVFPEAALAALDVPESERGEHEITDVLARVIDEHDIAAVETKRWLDVARPTDLVRANALVLDERLSRFEGAVSTRTTVEGAVVVAEDASVADGATLSGPVLVGRGATIEENAVLEGPTTVGADATVGRSAELAKTIVLPGAAVGKNVRLHDVVLGPNCEISAGAHIAGLEDETSNGTAAVVSDAAAGQGLSY